MIKFEKIIAEGIGSIINRLEYNLSVRGLTLITGENGAGKTTIFNVLSWVLYKQLLKKGSSLEPWQHIKPENYKGMYGEVIFYKGEDKYQIIRVNCYREKVFGKKRKNALIIIKNGEELSDRDKIDNQQKLIEILGYSFDLFKSAILFGQELKRMMGEDGPTKKKILEETFDASFINKARDLIIERNIPLKDEYYKLDREKSAQIEIKNNLVDLIEEGKQQKAEFNEKKQRRIENLESEIQELGAQRKELPKDYSRRIRMLENSKKGLEKGYDFNITDQELKLNFALHTARDVVDRLTSESRVLLDKYSKLPKECDRCGQLISEDKRKQLVQAIKREYTEKKTEIFHAEIKAKEAEKAYQLIKKKVEENEDKRKSIQELKSKITLYKNKQEDYLDTQKDNESLKKGIERLEDQIKNQKDLKLKINIKRLKKLVAKSENKINRINEEANKLDKKIKLNDWLINDPLSNSGLKAMIFDTMLSNINRQLKKYTRFIGFGIRMFIDLKSANKNVEIAILNEGNEVLYNDLSGGQKQLVDVILLFASNDVVYEAKPINILLLDEVFERLSKKNIDVISEIIQTKAGERCLHLITHLSTFAPIASRNIFIELDTQGHTKFTN